MSCDHEWWQTYLGVRLESKIRQINLSIVLLNNHGIIIRKEWTGRGAISDSIHTP